MLTPYIVVINFFHTTYCVFSYKSVRNEIRDGPSGPVENQFIS